MEDNKSVEETEEKVAIVGNIMKIKLSKKIKFNDVEIREINLDFGSLTGVDICEAESNFRDRFYVPVPDANYSFAYQAAVAAKASKLPYELILELNHRDFSAVTGATKGFLLG